MKGSTTTVRLIAGLCTVGLLSGGCVSLRELAGLAPQGDPSVALRPSEPKWLLIKNPRFGEVASEPEYIWVEEDKVPTTMKSLIFGKSSMIAPPEIVAKYGAPPGGGKISPGRAGPISSRTWRRSPTRRAAPWPPRPPRRAPMPSGAPPPAPSAGTSSSSIPRASSSTWRPPMA